MAGLLGFIAAGMMVLLFSSSAYSAAPSCSTVTQEVAPCATFVKGGSEAKPSVVCCKGVKDLSANASHKKDREVVCQCLKQVLSKIGNYKPSQVSLLPKKCGLSLSLPPIDQNTDCSKVAIYGW